MLRVDSNIDKLDSNTIQHRLSKVAMRLSMSRVDLNVDSNVDSNIEH